MHRMPFSNVSLSAPVNRGLVTSFDQTNEDSQGARKCLILHWSDHTFVLLLIIHHEQCASAKEALIRESN